MPTRFINDVNELVLHIRANNFKKFEEAIALCTDVTVAKKPFKWIKLQAAGNSQIEIEPKMSMLAVIALRYLSLDHSAKSEFLPYFTAYSNLPDMLLYADITKMAVTGKRSLSLSVMASQDIAIATCARLQEVQKIIDRVSKIHFSIHPNDNLDSDSKFNATVAKYFSGYRQIINESTSDFSQSLEVVKMSKNDPEVIKKVIDLGTSAARNYAKGTKIGRYLLDSAPEEFNSKCEELRLLQSSNRPIYVIPSEFSGESPYILGINCQKTINSFNTLGESLKSEILELLRVAAKSTPYWDEIDKKALLSLSATECSELLNVIADKTGKDLTDIFLAFSNIGVDFSNTQAQFRFNSTATLEIPETALNCFLALKSAILTDNAEYFTPLVMKFKSFGYSLTTELESLSIFSEALDKRAINCLLTCSINELSEAFSLSKKYSISKVADDVLQYEISNNVLTRSDFYDLLLDIAIVQSVNSTAKIKSNGFSGEYISSAVLSAFKADVLLAPVVSENAKNKILQELAKTDCYIVNSYLSFDSERDSTFEQFLDDLIKLEKRFQQHKIPFVLDVVNYIPTNFNDEQDSVKAKVRLIRDRIINTSLQVLNDSTEASKMLLEKQRFVSNFSTLDILKIPDSLKYKVKAPEFNWKEIDVASIASRTFYSEMKRLSIDTNLDYVSQLLDSAKIIPEYNMILAELLVKKQDICRHPRFPDVFESLQELRNVPSKLEYSNLNFETDCCCAAIRYSNYEFATNALSNPNIASQLDIQKLFNNFISSEISSNVHSTKSSNASAMLLCQKLCAAEEKIDFLTITTSIKRDAYSDKLLNSEDAEYSKLLYSAGKTVKIQIDDMSLVNIKMASSAVIQFLRNADAYECMSLKRAFETAVFAKILENVNVFSEELKNDQAYPRIIDEIRSVVSKLFSTAKRIELAQYILHDWHENGLLTTNLVSKIQLDDWSINGIDEILPKKAAQSLSSAIDLEISSSTNEFSDSLIVPNANSPKIRL